VKLNGFRIKVKNRRNTLEKTLSKRLFARQLYCVNSQENIPSFRPIATLALEIAQMPKNRGSRFDSRPQETVGRIRKSCLSKHCLDAKGPRTFCFNHFRFFVSEFIGISIMCNKEEKKIWTMSGDKRLWKE